ncbi:MAG: hypothetical protein AAF226_18280, partial [Verrucomicrobiota bacterium]
MKIPLPKSEEIGHIPAPSSFQPNQDSMLSPSNNWTLDHTDRLYCVNGWSDGFFQISDTGALEVTAPESENPISLLDLVETVKSQGHQLPLLVRVPKLLDHKIQQLRAVFDDAIAQNDYRGSYTPYFPIKTNQQRAVLDQIVSTYSDDGDLGLEVGTKPELLAAVTAIGTRNIPIICNGYKDESYLDLAQRLGEAGLDVTIVLESLNEAKLFGRCIGDREIAVRLGLRFRPETAGSSHWAETSGKNGLFGFKPFELYAAIDLLKKLNLSDSVDLLHFHQASQITALHSIREGAQEIAKVFEALVEDGLPIKRLDMGGGLAVDYQGSGDFRDASRDYEFAAYADTIVRVIKSAMDSKGIEHPEIISESGRAISAHHAFLLAETFTNASPERLPSLA